MSFWGVICGVIIGVGSRGVYVTLWLLMVGCEYKSMDIENQWGKEDWREWMEMKRLMGEVVVEAMSRDA